MWGSSLARMRSQKLGAFTLSSPTLQTFALKGGAVFYGKIFEQIYESSVVEDWKAMVVFQQLIVLSDQDGTVDMTPESIQRRTNLPEDIISHGLAELQKPDIRSRSSLSDGRRIVLIDDHRDWGWTIVNYKTYRDKASRAERNELRKVQMRQQRAEEKALKNQTRPTSSDSVSDVSHTVSVSVTGKEEKTKAKKKPTSIPNDFQPSQANIEYARIHRLPLVDILETFKAKTTAEGKTYVDWHAGLTTYLQNARKWGEGSAPRRGGVVV